METGSLSAQADYNLDGFTLTSITAGGYTNWYPHLDADAVGIPIITTGNQTTYQRQFSQELRVTSPLGGAVDYTGGLFFFYQRLNDHAVTTYGRDAASVFLDTPPNSGATYQATQAALNSAEAPDHISLGFSVAKRTHLASRKLQVLASRIAEELPMDRIA